MSFGGMLDDRPPFDGGIPANAVLSRLADHDHPGGMGRISRREKER
jgi:hypothetical protein